VSYWHLSLDSGKKGEIGPNDGYALGAICDTCLKARITKAQTGDFHLFLAKMVVRVPVGDVGVFEVTGATGQPQPFLLAVHRIGR
jgi:hypothetical protein